MKKKKSHPILIRLLSLVLVLAIMLALAVMLVPFQFHDEDAGYTDYGNWMAETLSGDVRMVDVAMPGAHESLSYEIDFLSEVDAASAAAPLNQVLLKGLAVRQSKTQELTVKEQLASGVRYLDLRVSYDEAEKKWYGVCNFKSVLLSQALLQVNDFLLSHPGEVVILAFRCCYDSREADGLAGTKGAEELYELLEDSGLTYFMPEDVDLATVTYGELTDEGSHSAALVLMEETGDAADLLPYEGSVYSVSYDTDSAEAVFSGLNDTAKQIVNSVSAQTMLRVQQDVLTMQSGIIGVLRSVSTWSLLRRADAFNEAWLSAYETTSVGTELDWLAAMPIVLMDNAGVGDNAEQLMELIIEYDLTLG
ncbi:MAG: hypothetical protein LUD82_09465 [Clostridiales bacterium]|nr:hypothetical protein [Clostridiales bacterium]